MYFDGARRRLEGPGDLGAAIAEGVAHKLERFEAGDPTLPRLGVYDGIVGAPVADLRSERPADFEVVVEDAARLRDVDPNADLVPARLVGGIVAREGGSAAPPLAIAVNGVVAAVTRPYSFSAFGYAVPWEALVDPELIEPGANTVGVFAIRDGPDGSAVLHEAFAIARRRRAVNLVLEGAAIRGVVTSGLLPTESSGYGRFRWTTGAARLSAKIDPRFAPSALAVRILMTGPQKRLRIAVDGCTLFDGPVWGRWSGTFALDACRTDSSTLEIELVSNVHLDGIERQRLGVAVSAVELHGGGPPQ